MTPHPRPCYDSPPEMTDQPSTCDPARRVRCPGCTSIVGVVSPDWNERRPQMGGPRTRSRWPASCATRKCCGAQLPPDAACCLRCGVPGCKPAGNRSCYRSDCAICHKLTTALSGPYLFIADTDDLVCWDCRPQLAPELMKMLGWYWRRRTESVRRRRRTRKRP